MSNKTRNTTTATASNVVTEYATYVKACRATERAEKDYGTALDGAVNYLFSVMGKDEAWWEPNPKGDIKTKLEQQRKAHANAWAAGFKDPKKVKAERSKASMYWKRIIEKARKAMTPEPEEGEENTTTDYAKSAKELVTIYNRGTKEGAEPESIELSKALKPILIARNLIA